VKSESGAAKSSYSAVWKIQADVPKDLVIYMVYISMDVPAARVTTLCQFQRGVSEVCALSCAVTVMSIFISPLQQQNHTRKLKYNKLTYTIHGRRMEYVVYLPQR